MPSDAWTAAKILIVDDEPTNIRLLERVLATAGYRNVTGITDPRQALGIYRELEPDIVLLDLMMPHLDGVAVLEQLKTEIAPKAYVPVLVLTADATLDAKRRALVAGAKDFLTKPFEQTEVILRIGNLLETRALYVELDAHNRALEQTVKERSERLLQSEKVATMGALLAGVAHELNNPLAVLSGQTQLLRETVTEPDIVRRADKISGAADRCVRIVRNFLALARQRPPERTHVWLSQLVAGAVELLAYGLRTDDVAVELDFPPGLPTLWADPHQLHQVFVNLIGNAHQAMRGHPRPHRILITARHDVERARVRLEVMDTGPGMPPEVRAKAFEAFFTTKPVGEGTGLGLSLCRGIVEEHGGTIDIESEPGRGARFVIELPVGAPARTAMGPAAVAPSPSVTRRHVLVVDDEPELAAVIAEAVTRDGHTADVAGNGAIALDMIAARPYDLVISDTKMPVLDGEVLYRELNRRFPALRRRIIFLTGDILSREKREFLEGTGAPFLTKPCDLSEVRQLVRHVLTAADPTTTA